MKTTHNMGSRVWMTAARWSAALGRTILRSIAGPVRRRRRGADLPDTTRSAETLNREIAERQRVEAELLAINRVLAAEIARREQAEAQRQASEEKFRTLFKTSGDAIMTLEPPAWRFTSGNPATVKMFKAQDEAEFVRCSPWEFSPDCQPDGARSEDRAKAMIERAMQEGSHCFEWTHRRADGGVFPTTVLLTRVTWGDKVFLQATVRDITERKKAEQEQAELLARLAEINQELKEFAYVVSHDLKAPLRAIKTLADWLATDYQDRLDEQGQENLQLLGSRVDRMQSLIDGVLQYSRVGRTEQSASPVALDRIVPELMEDLGAPAHISIEIESELPTVVADPTRITQVFQNLLSNAIKYMDKPQGRIVVACADAGAFWKFSVRDNGPGIEARHFERIFKLFQTLSPHEDGESTGVGLTITRKIVELYGGKIWVESEVGQGSTFWFTIPKTTQKETQEVLQACAVG